VPEFWQLAIPVGIALFSWIIWVDRTLRHNRRVGDRLLEMHEHPETTGFGTVGMKEVVEDNTKAIRGLSAMLRWFMEKQGGELMPPFEEA